MNPTTYRFSFADLAQLDEAESTLHLAILAAEGLYGEALLRVEFAYSLDDEGTCLHVHGGNDVSDTVVRIFTALAIKEFGATAFTVSSAPRGRPEEVLAMAT